MEGGYKRHSPKCDIAFTGAQKLPPTNKPEELYAPYFALWGKIYGTLAELKAISSVVEEAEAKGSQWKPPIDIQR